MAHVLYLSILLVMRLSTFNGPFIIWNYFYKFYVKRINPPNIMPHVVLNALSDPSVLTYTRGNIFLQELFLPNILTITP